ncbi:MAG: stage II sporulation protein P [Ruminococcus sp.]|nr:stage II sporulation protein P [Ruminococcus sp.]
MDRKGVCLRSLGVISAVLLLPLGIAGFAAAVPAITAVTASSAAVTLGRSIEPPQNSTADKPMLVRAPISVGCRDIDAAPEEIQPTLPDDSPAETTPSSEIAVLSPPAELIASEPYPENQDSRDGVIEKLNFGRYTGEQFFDLDGGGQVRNCSDEYTNSELLEESRKPPDFSGSITSGEPLVLIYHTHTSESYEPSDRPFYDASFASKTTDPSKNVTAVGDRICAELDAAGIPYIHDTLIHDHPSYNDAYDSSRATVKELLKQYPSIRIALDIHRDGLQREDGTRLSPVAEIDSRDAAQIMIISGCDDGTMGMPEHLKNFRFACALQSELESSFPGLTRPVLFDYRHYNQDLTTGSLLIEVGSHGNCLEQALYAGELVGKGLCSVIQHKD